MRALLVVMALSGVCLADEQLSREDDLRLTIAALQAQLAQAHEALAQCQVQRKYGLADGDTYDPKTLAIRRAPKPAAKPEPRK